MPPGYTYSIIATATTLAALRVPFPVEITALAMVGLVLRWALIRQNHAHDEHDARITKVEEELAVTRQAKDIERQLKHAWRSEVSATRATLGTILPLAQRCSCGTMEPLLPVLERLAHERKEPPHE